MNQPLHYTYCTSFWSRLRGLMFRVPLAPEQVFVFKVKKASRLEAAVHTLFVFFPFQLIWLDTSGRVVDSRQARPFRFYWPKSAARTILEAHRALPCEVGTQWPDEFESE